MESAELIADVDMKSRSLVRSASAFKTNRKRIIRSFGGLNVLCSGDVWQLPSPERGFLVDIPCECIQNARKYLPSPNIAHGQRLLWSGPETGILGVTELHECEITQDMWIQIVQNEFRHGRLTDNTYKLLYGLPTMLPGSCIDGEAICNNGACK